MVELTSLSTSRGMDLVAKSDSFSINRSLASRTVRSKTVLRWHTRRILMRCAPQRTLLMKRCSRRRDPNHPRSHLKLVEAVPAAVARIFWNGRTVN